jgi:peroxiredoxin family protein
MSRQHPVTKLLAKKTREEKAYRDAKIVEAYLACGTIHSTVMAFNHIYSREVVRTAIANAGIYDKCKRNNHLIEKAKSRKIKPLSNHDKVSKIYRSELEMQKHASSLLETEGINHEAEVKLNGCSMRADFVGSNWAIETKKECTSQGIMVGMAQCLTYRKHLGKRYVCILLPDDLEPGQFYVSECMSYGIPIIKLKDLIWWVRTVEDNAQPN